MLRVDSQQRASLDEVASHEWLGGVATEETVLLPSVSSIDEIPSTEMETILTRMEQGGYGSIETIMK